MPSPVIEDTISTIESTVGVMESARVAITGIAARIEAAVAAALVNGATAAELAPVSAEVALLKAKSQELSDAIAANP